MVGSILTILEISPVLVTQFHIRRNEETDMKVEDIKLYYAYNEWANNRILDAAERASLEQLTRPNEFGWGDLRGALVHILDAEYGWFSFLFGREDEGILEPESFDSIAALRERWQKQSATTRQCLDTLSEQDPQSRPQQGTRGEKIRLGFVAGPRSCRQSWHTTPG